MSTARILTIVGICFLIAGCAPVAGIKGLAALFISIMAVAGAGWGIMHDKDENRVCLKAQELDKEVTAHEKKYHQTPPEGTVVALKPISKSNGAAAPNTESSLSQRI
jgi:hypothetical protein